jgi:hypothetical protein
MAKGRSPKNQQQQQQQQQQQYPTSLDHNVYVREYKSYWIGQQEDFDAAATLIAFAADGGWALCQLAPWPRYVKQADGDWAESQGWLCVWWRPRQPRQQQQQQESREERQEGNDNEDGDGDGAE